uniref:Uncharacterized protein n=1 Tax=Rhizophora mucronata TaxID=61149 RepID=A0A2P2QKR1_RHIMU
MSVFAFIQKLCLEVASLEYGDDCLLLSPVL